VPQNIVYFSIEKEGSNMTQSQVEQKIQEIRSKAEDTFFSVHFIKKNGELRKMVARLKVSKGVKGIGHAYDPTSKGLLCVFDVQKEAFIMINIKTIQHLQIRGESIV
jgi:hypothetical protein